MKKKYWIILLFLVPFLSTCNHKLSSKLNSNSKTGAFSGSPKREFRAAWIATVDNIDWPSKKTLSSEQQQDEFVKILNNHQKIGINAVLVQVRAASDAFYARSTEPWSEWLTGQQGKAPDPLYDPMRFMIEESHSRNMEFHAWLNLNRGKHKVTKSVAKNHITNLKPEWFLEHGGYTLFNFGLPEVRTYIVGVVTNIVKSYDVDGIHFDDYFYPYTIANESLKDQNTFKKYGKSFNTIEDWRRNNISVLIKDISKAIIAEKKWVKFGISPFGVWRNAKVDPQGSRTEAGQTSYDDLFADTRKWTKAGWIDYIAPQVYFAMEHPKVPYQDLTEWWKRNHFNRHLFIGHSTYRIDKESKDINWKNPSQFPRQIRYNRKNDEISGSIFFNTTSLVKNNLGFCDSLKKFYANPALQPAMPWKDSTPPVKPENLEVKKNKDASAQLSWEIAHKSTKTKDDINSFVVYRFDEGQAININNSKNIIAIVRNSGILKYNDDTINKRKSYVYILTSLDRLHNESKPSNQYFFK